MRHFGVGRPAAFLSLTLIAMSIATAQEWTRFRGPNGTGVSQCTTIPVQWTEADYRWQAKLPGRGHSSPVVWGDRVFLMSADPATATRYVLCYSAVDGRQLWLREYASTPHRLNQRSSYANGTPAVDAEQVYVAWATPQQLTLRAFDHNGQERWSRDLGPWVGEHGFGGSPIVEGDLVILHNSQQGTELDPGQQPGQSSMVAVNRRTGEEVWRTPLPTDRVCYSVPFRYLPDGGTPELICTSTGRGVFSLDPHTGALNWSVDVFTMRVVNSPILAGGLIFSSNGSGGYSGNYLVAVRPGKTPELVHKLRSSNTMKAPYVPSFVALDDAVFLIHDQRFAGCVDAATGKVRWLERTESAFSGSPIRVCDKIYCIDEKGDVWVIAADPQRYRLLARNPLGEPSRSTPAVSAGRMFLRTESRLFCIGGGNQVAAGS